MQKSTAKFMLVWFVLGHGVGLQLIAQVVSVLYIGSGRKEA